MIIIRKRVRWISAVLLLICVALIVFARSGRSNKNAYSLAGDLPRGALVYAQLENVPDLISAVLLLICVALIVFARSGRSNKNAYSLAGDLPRGALVYAQLENVPELIKQWDQSQLKDRYLSSTNY